MKLFKNCPNEERNVCDDCPMLNKCIMRKIKRRAKTKIGVLTAFVTRNIAAIFICVVILSAIIGCFKLNNKSQTSYITKIVQTQEPNITYAKYCEVRTLKKQEQTQTISTNKDKVEKKEETKNKKVKKKQEEKKEEATISAYKPGKEYYYHVSDSDKKSLEKVVYMEARGESLEGQVAVAAVVLNRYVKAKKRVSVEKIIKQKGQFANISGVTEKKLKAYPNCKKAVEQALKGWDPTRKGFSKGARYFYEPELVSEYQKKIREGVKTLKIGCHLFHNDFNE